MIRPSIIIAAVLLLSGCTSDPVAEALKTITPESLEPYVRNLGSDEFMGRKPFTDGERITVDYLASELGKIGFSPAFGESWFQPVKMVELASKVNGPVSISTGSEVINLNAPDDIAVISPQITGNISVQSSDMVFAGFGIVAPEYGRNDFAGLDVKGKTIVVMINDPGLYTGDTTYFKGKDMTYYGRWTYKFEEAARQGAEGILIIHESIGAGYEYTIPRKSSITPRLYMQEADSNRSMCKFTGWITGEAADKIFSARGIDVKKLRQEACKKDFRGFPMEAKLSLAISNKTEFNTSTNVAGILEGTTRKDECVIYSAHWDHFGIGEKENGDSIYNGAVDNGTSMAWAFAIGRAFSSLKDRPERSVIILFPTAEEQGLLGSGWYTTHPVLPMEKTAACFNNDLMLPIGRMKDVMITGYGQSELDDMIREAAKKQDRYVIRDPNSSAGMYFRSDHFPFAKMGVPAAFARGNVDSREKGREWTAEQERDYIKNKYHRPADNYEPATWDLSGIAEDAQLAFTVGYQIASSDKFPAWKPGSEFASARMKKP